MNNELRISEILSLNLNPTSYKWLEQTDIEFIRFDDLNLDTKKHKKDGTRLRPCANLNNLKFTYHSLTDFGDININEEEIKAIYSIEHKNILKSFISRSERFLEYYLLAEIVDQGNLANYLEHTELNWDQRINLASQLISGLEFLHNNQIVHSNLNPKNVLLHHDILKLTNFGGLNIFKSDDFENIPYVEPQALTLGKGFIKSSCGKNSSNIFGIKSNIYSLGVLLWQISSGFQPYNNLTPVRMIEYIDNGGREEPVYGTPIKYYELYQDCWQSDSEKRPDCLMALKMLGLVDINNVISQYVQEIPQNSQDSINKFFLQKWNLHKGLRVHDNTFIHGEEIITENGIITPHKAKQSIQIYTNISSNPFDILKNECISNQMSVDICLHIRLLDVEYEKYTISDGFIRNIEEILKNPDQKSVRKALQETFEKYGDYIAEKIVIGGALKIKSACLKDRKSLLQDIDTLKACVYWVNDHIVSGNPNIFSHVPFNNIFIAEDMNDNQRITSGHELKAWIEGFYEHKKGYVIAFGKIVPIYTLLKDEIKQEIIKVCGMPQNIDKKLMIVPYITNSQNPKDLNNWAKNSPLIHLCHWTNNLCFHYGLNIQQNNIKHGLEIALEFLGIPELYLLDKSYMYLRRPSNKQDAFTLANQIKIDDINVKEIPFLTESLTSFHPIFDNEHKSNEVHCSIVSEKIKLAFGIDKLKPSQMFLEAVDEAFNSDYPFRSLKSVFDKFGYFCPQSIILGRTFSKTYNNIQLIKDEYVDFDMNEDESKIVEKTLEEWNKSVKILNTALFLDFNGDIVKSNEIYSLLKNLDEKQNWNIVMQDLIPLYKILPKVKQKNIESIVSNNYHIVMTGTTIIRSNQTYINIQFENPLHDNNYEMFGCLVVDEQKVSVVMIRFNLANQYGCRATIHKLDNRSSIPVGAQVFWIVLAKGYGYFSKQSRDIKIDFGKKIITDQLPINVEILSSTWSNSCIFVTNFDSKDLDKNQIIKSKIKECSKVGTMNVEVFQYNSEEIQSKILENVTMRWCMIDTNQKFSITTEVGTKSFSWNLLGDYITSNKNLRDHSESAIKIAKIADHSESAIKIAKIADTVSSFLPVLDAIAKLINEIVGIYEKSEFNKNMCSRLVDRVIMAECEIKRLRLTKM
ncbi:32951_t:CDS:2, partial [Racocetra persica]